MKKAKKLTGILLLIAMLFMITAPAMATGENTNPGTISIDNAKKGETYAAYKIFDVAYDTKVEEGTEVAGDHYSYTIESSSQWFTTVQEYANKSNSGLTLTQITGTNTYNVKNEAAFSPAEFAIALNDAKTGKTADKSLNMTDEDTTPTISGLELGYYFVTTNAGALCNLTTTNPTVTIHNKNDIPFDKTVDEHSVEVGQTVTYTITGKVPNTAGFNKYIYNISDTMSDGLTFKKDVVVKIGETVKTDECSVTYKPNDENATGFELTVPVMEYQDKVGQTITVTYSATVNENAVAEIEKNHATLKYSNNPKNGDETDIITDEEKVYSAKIVINKYADNNKTKKLSGATFVLYRYALPMTNNGSSVTYTFAKANGQSYTEADVKETDGLVKVYYKENIVENKITDVSWYQLQDRETIKGVSGTKVSAKTTLADGVVNFEGLEDGTYYLEETVAPAGYNLLTAPVEVTINGASATEANFTALTVTKDVENKSGALLPSTGGMGTTIFYVLGAVLVVGAGVLLVTKKRMSNQR